MGAHPPSEAQRPPSQTPWGGFRRGAGLPGGREAAGSRRRAGGTRCRDRCRSSGCGPPAAPAAGSDGRWHSRWSAGCPGPLQSKQSAGHQGQRLRGFGVCFGQAGGQNSPLSVLMQNRCLKPWWEWEQVITSGFEHPMSTYLVPTMMLQP